MPTNTAISTGRRLAGPAALVATAGGIAAIALHDTQWIEWGLLSYGGLVGAAGVGLARRALPLQVLARATAWTVLVPSVLVGAVSMMQGHTEWTAAALAAGSGGALLLARPMLHTKEARAEFAPSSFRRWLFAGATASASAGIITGLFALDGMRWHTGTAIPLLGLSLSLLASAVGVVRMRAWGVLLGALTSVLTLIAAAFMHDGAGLALALATIPGFMLILPVLIAQRERAKAEASSSSSSFTRVSSHVSFDDAPSRVRIATDSSGSLDDDTDSSDDALAAAPPPAARAQA
jgi:hypothetical protein